VKKILNHEIDFERIVLLFHSAPIAINGLLVGYFAFIFAFKDLLPTNYLVLWSIAFLLILLWRIGILISFKRKMANETANLKLLQKYELIWVVNSVFLATIFASMVYMPFKEDTLIALLFITMVLMGLSAGSAISSYASIKVVVVFLTFTALPIIFKTIYDAQPYSYIIAFVYGFFYLVLIRLTIAGNHIVIENLQLKKYSEEKSLKDSLTGLWNRRRLMLFTEKLIPQSIRHKQKFSIMLLDIDHFKEYNDKHGHLKGDEALIDVANCLQKEARDDDLVVRFGGEEFLIILPETEIETAQAVIKRIMKTIRRDTDITISAGLAMFSKDVTFEQLVKAADDALYLAKKHGRDQYIVSD